MDQHKAEYVAITSFCQQICGGGGCGVSRVCHNGIDPRTEIPFVDRYADSVIADRATQITQFEVNGVSEFQDEFGIVCEEDNGNPEFFSVYVRIKEVNGFAEAKCVGDFGTYSDAASYAKLLSERYQRSVVDRFLLANSGSRAKSA